MKLPFGQKRLRAVRPNAGVAAIYRKRIERMIDEMARSYYRWLRAQYRESPPRMAMDETPAKKLARLLAELGKQWQRNFDKGADDLARYFAKSADVRSRRDLMRILKDAGFTVRFRMTPAMRDILDATVKENVSLIKSIPQQFHTQVEGLVMRSVTAGRDLSGLTRDLQKQFGVTRRRAEFIALDQNNKCTSALMRARQLDLGLEEGIWMHSHAGKEPRPTHLANDGKKFSIRQGWFDPDPKVRKRIWPGQLPRCRCTWGPVVKGFS